jgi:ATP-dependent Lhr-like helicase
VADVTAELERDVQIAALLPRAWPYFFAPFGRLTAVQRAAIAPILAGKDVLIESATASGKTEAACAPLVERHVGDRRPWTVLYISPTRALVNDLHERLHLPLSQLHLRLERRTGEHRSESSRHAHVLLTTPESFDSMLCRGRTTEPDGHRLATVSAVVLDEIHLLDGTARGEQARWLLERLRRLRAQAKRAMWTSSDRVQVVALSATIPNPDEVIDRYLRGGEHIAIPGGRPIEIVQAPGGEADVEMALPAYLAPVTGPKKALVFANSRNRVDSLTAMLRRTMEPLGYAVFAHHGSLDRSEREATEEAVKSQSRIVVVATATLEIGIDIGDIDLVVLDGPPPDISSLLQRIGRGNRRGNVTCVMACNAGPLAALVSSAMIDAARDGWLGRGERGPQHAVARQQTASYIFQAPKRTRARSNLQTFLEALAPPVVAQHLLLSMLASGELVEDQHGVRLGETWLELASRGDIHSCIEDAGGSKVIDERTGRVIAHGIQQHAGSGIRTGGHLLQVRRWNDFKIEVRQTTSSDLAAGNWRYSSQPRAQGSGQPEAVRRYLGIPETEWPIVQDDRWAYCFHFGGARRKQVIELAAEQASHRLERHDVNDWYMKLTGSSLRKPTWLTSSSPATLDVAIAARLEHLERGLGRPRANAHLPQAIRIDEVRGWLQIDDELDNFRQAQVSAPTDVALRHVLLSLVAALR